MPFATSYSEEAPSREEVDQSVGLIVLEFGANWCGFCQELSPELRPLLNGRSDVQHIRVADGKGKRLGRSFGVKLWPTLVFLRDGQEVATLVRPTGDEAAAALERLQAE